MSVAVQRLKKGLSKAKAPLYKVAAWPIRPWLGSVEAVVTNEKVTALTFDDGPHPEYTSRLLDILAARDAKATFFIVGDSAEKYPKLLKRMAAEGHCLANHTWDHRSMPLLTRRERLEQLRACAKALAPFGGDNKLFRPPYGNQNVASRLDALSLGYEVVAWTHHCYDWLEHDAEFLTEQMVKSLSPGSIFLLHDALYRIAEPERANRTPSLKAVETLISRFPEYRFVTVPKLLTHGHVKKAMWFQKPDKTWLARVGLGGQ